MSWDQLPTEIKVYILSLRFSLQNKNINKAATVIQKFWKRLDIQHKTIISLVPQGWMCLGDRRLAKFLKFCNLFDILKLKKYIPFWVSLQDDIEDQIMKDNLYDTPFGGVDYNYNMTYNNYSILLERIHSNKNIRLYY